MPIKFNPFSGNFDIVNPPGGVAGGNSEVQYNDSGAFGGSANFTYDNDTLSVTGTNAGTLATGVIDLYEISTPDNPDTNHGFIYVKDATGTTTPYFLDSAGTETNILTSGTGAPIDCRFVVGTANAALTNEMDLSTLATGSMIKVTTNGAFGTLSAATADVDYQLPYWLRDTTSAFIYPNTTTDSLAISGHTSLASGSGMYVGGELTVASDATLYGDLTVATNAYIDGNMAVYGAFTSDGLANFTENVTIGSGSGLYVEHDSTFATTVTILSYLSCGSSTFVDQELLTYGDIYGGGGLTVSSTSSLDGDVVVQRDKFVICDDYTDEGINACIDKLGAEGGEVYLPEGTYAIDGNIAIDYSNTTLRGAGGGTILDASGWSNDHVITVSTHDTCSITNLKIIGQAGGGNATNLIYFDDCLDCSVENCILESSDNDGIRVDQDGDNFKATNNLIKSCDGVGIYLNYAPNCVVAQNQVTSSGSTGIQVWNSSNYNDISDNVIITTGTYGISSNSNFANITGNIISTTTQGGIYVLGVDSVVDGNVIINAGYDGIYLYTGDRIIISNNTIRNPGRRGIYTANTTQELLITGNNISSAGNTYDDIYLDDSRYTVINNNRFESETGASERAINAVSGSHHLTIIGNVSYGHDTAGIVLDATCNTCSISSNNITDTTPYTISSADNKVEAIQLLSVHDGTEPAWDHSPTGLAVEGTTEFDDVVYSDASITLSTGSGLYVGGNATLGSGVLYLQETTTPTAYDSMGALYTKNDNTLYFQDGAGTESAVKGYWSQTGNYLYPTTTTDSLAISGSMSLNASSLYVGGELTCATTSWFYDTMSLSSGAGPECLKITHTTPAINLEGSADTWSMKVQNDSLIGYTMFYILSNSSDNSSRDLITLVNANASADNTTPLYIESAGDDYFISASCNAFLTAAGVWQDNPSCFEDKCNLTTLSSVTGYIDKLRNMNMYKYKKRIEVYGQRRDVLSDTPSDLEVTPSSPIRLKAGDTEYVLRDGKYYEVIDKVFSDEIKNPNTKVHTGYVLDDPTTPDELIERDKDGNISGLSGTHNANFLMAVVKELIQEVDDLKKQLNP
jgi:parallel beta-helix repeat protein